MSAREALEELERERLERKDALSEADKVLEQALIERDKAARAEADTKRRAEEARKEAMREAQLRELREQAEEQNSEIARLTAKFTERAIGHLWYEGTGHDDAILEHQWTGMMFGAVAKRWLCGDEMGLGKTRVAIGWLDLIQARRVIVITEPNLCDNFAGEVMELAPHRTLTNIYKQLPDRRHELLDTAVSKDEGIIVVNYELFRRDKDALAKLMSWQADTVIVDEAHNVKSTATANYRYVETIVTVDNTCGKCGQLVKGLYDPEGLKRKPSQKIPKPCPNCGWKVGQATGVRTNNKLVNKLRTRSVKNLLMMTGTPILNEPGDLYPMLHLIDPMMFRTMAEFRDTFCQKNYHSDKWEFRAGALDRLKPLIEGRFLARTKGDAGIELPPHHVNVVPVDLDPRQYPLQHRTIKQITQAAQIVLDSGKQMTIMHLIALITRKRQANVYPGGIKILHPETGEVLFDVGEEVTESAKLDAVVESIERELADGHRQIVFSQFTGALKELEARLKERGVRVALFVGKTGKAERQRIKYDFDRRNDSHEIDVVLAHYKIGGAGLNLTAATVTHILDEEWNPGRRNQAYARNYRMGQVDETRVFVYRIPGSIDTWMSSTINRKERLIDSFEGKMRDEEPKELTVESFRKALEGGEML